MHVMAKPFLLGILGGMGPMATVDLMQKIILATPAQRDQQHLPMVIWNVPQVPDRQYALAGTGPSPLAALHHGIRQLNQAGATHIVIACNTAHAWYDALATDSQATLLHIADITTDALLSQAPRPRAVGLIATRGTLDAGWFQSRLTAAGITPVLPEGEETERWFVPGCYAVKRGDIALGGELLAQQARALQKRGAERLILACTEVPLALETRYDALMAISLDPARALAQTCVKYWQESQL